MDELTLDRARREVGLSVTELWLRYFALGGDSTPAELEALLHAPESPGHQHNLIAHAINERHVELGGGHPVPYVEGTT